MKPSEIKKLNKLYNYWLDHDPTPAEQVGWSNTRDQEDRFMQFLKVIKKSDKVRGFSILDIGCGDGALLDFLQLHLPNSNIAYTGIDINSRYLERARHSFTSDATFLNSDFDSFETRDTFDFVVASGTYNVNVFSKKQDAYDFMARVIPKMIALAKNTVIFNLLVEKEADGVVLTGDMFIYDKEKILEICKLHCDSITTMKGYDPHDLTFVLTI